MPWLTVAPTVFWWQCPGSLLKNRFLVAMTWLTAAPTVSCWSCPGILPQTLTRCPRIASTPTLYPRKQRLCRHCVHGTVVVDFANTVSTIAQPFLAGKARAYCCTFTTVSKSLHLARTLTHTHPHAPILDSAESALVNPNRLTGRELYLLPSLHTRT